MACTEQRSPMAARSSFKGEIVLSGQLGAQVLASSGDNGGLVARKAVARGDVAGTPTLRE